MIKKIVYLPVRVFAILAGFISIVCFPYLLSFRDGGMKIDFSLFKEKFMAILHSFMKIEWFSFLSNFFQEEGQHMYVYTMKILTTSLFIVWIVGIIVAISIMLLPPRVRKGIVHIIHFTSTAPELLILFLLQFGMIYIYKTYGIKLFQLYGFFNKEPFFAPIVIVSFLPTIFFIQIILKEFADEEQQDYVLFARSKGLPYMAIYFKHIIRNIFPLFIIHFRTITWFLLTTIFVMENLFSIRGYLAGLRRILFYSPSAYLVGLFLFALPIVITTMLASIITTLIKRKENSSI